MICLRKAVKIFPDLFHSSRGEKKELIAEVNLENKMCISKSWLRKFKYVSRKHFFPSICIFLTDTYFYYVLLKISTKCHEEILSI